MKALLRSALDLVYPSACAACDQPLLTPEGLCPVCLESCTRIEIACPTCALPIAGPLAIRCARCRKGGPGLDSCRAVFEYGGQIAVALKRLKFAGRNDVARSLGPLLGSAFAEVGQAADLAVAVPLDRKRLARRGFNQSQRLLLHLARGSQLPVRRSALCRTRPTAPQAQLKARERRANLRGAFAASPSVAGARVLLLDDVLTTGETLRAAALALRAAGAREIHAFVVARAD